MIDQPTYEKDNLDTFSTLFLVKGILNLLLALFFIAYAFLGGAFMKLGESSEGFEELPFNPMWIFLIVGGIGFLFSLIFAILTLLSAKYLKERKRYTFIFVMAILNCLTGVLGILLGIFTILELNKPYARKAFGKM